MFRNVNKIEEFAGHFNNLNLRYAVRLRGFDPNEIFVEHLLSFCFKKSFIHTLLNEDKDNDENTPAPDAGDLETLQSTNELHKQQGKDPGENSVQSPAATPKSTKSRSIAPKAHPSKKSTHDSSKRGGYKNPPSSKIDSSHKLPVRKKRKNAMQEAKEPGTESEDMELDTGLENVFPNVDQPGEVINHNPLMEIAETEIFDEDESFVFQSVVFDSESKNLIIEKRDVRNKKEKSCSEINLRNM
jgi:hypothetical protein